MAPAELVVEVVGVEQGAHALLNPVHGQLGRVAEVEGRLQVPGDNIVGTGTGRDIRDLKGGGGKVLVSPVPDLGVQGRQDTGEAVDGIHRALGVGHVALDAPHQQLPVEGTAPAIAQSIAEPLVARWLAHQAPVDALAAIIQCLEHAHRAVHRGPLFVAGDQQRHRRAPRAVVAEKALTGGDECGDAALHVCGTAAIEQTVAHLGFEGRGRPLGFRARGHYIGVTGKGEHRSLVAVARPQVTDLAAIDGFAGKSQRFQARAYQRLATGIVGCDRRPCHQLHGQP